MTFLDRIILLLTGLTAIYALWQLFGAYQKEKALYQIYYMLGFGVLLVSGLLLIFLGWDILASPLVLTVATLIPLGLSMGIMNQFHPEYKKYFSWFALAGLLAIAATAFTAQELKKFAVPLFHGVAGLILFLGPIFAEKSGKAAKGFWWVGFGGLLIGLGGIALAFIGMGSQLLFFSPTFVMKILAVLLLAMTLAFTWGFKKNL
jgi:hypothetical protein